MHETAPALQMLPGAYLSRLCHPTDAPGHPTVVQTIAALCSCSKPRQGTRMMQRIQAKVHSLPANKPHSRCACRGELCPVASDWSSPRQHLPDHGIRPPAGAVPIHTLRRLYGVWMAVLFLVVDGAVARGGWVDGGGGWGVGAGARRCARRQLPQLPSHVSVLAASSKPPCFPRRILLSKGSLPLEHIIRARRALPPANRTTRHRNSSKPHGRRDADPGSNAGHGSLPEGFLRLLPPVWSRAGRAEHCAPQEQPITRAG
jgi:hypothetical protein